MVKKKGSTTDSSGSSKGGRSQLTPKQYRARGGTDGYKKTWSAFNEQLRPLGLVLRMITADGNCLFRALSDQLWGQQDRHMEMRGRIVDYMRTHPLDYAPFIFDMSYEDYLMKMRRNGEWGGAAELSAASRAFGVHISVHQYQAARLENLYDPSLITPDPNSNADPPLPLTPDTKTIHLSYHDNEHYSAVRAVTDANSMEPAVHTPLPTATSSSSAASSSSSSSTTPQTHQETIVYQSSGCRNLVKIRKLLRENWNDADTVVEILFAEQNMGLDLDVDHDELQAQQEAEIERQRVEEEEKQKKRQAEEEEEEKKRQQQRVAQEEEERRRQELLLQQQQELQWQQQQQQELQWQQQQLQQQAEQERIHQQLLADRRVISPPTFHVASSSSLFSSTPLPSLPSFSPSPFSPFSPFPSSSSSLFSAASSSFAAPVFVSASKLAAFVSPPRMVPPQAAATQLNLTGPFSAAPAYHATHATAPLAAHTPAATFTSAYTSTSAALTPVPAATTPSPAVAVGAPPPSSSSSASAATAPSSSSSSSSSSSTARSKPADKKRISGREKKLAQKQEKMLRDKQKRLNKDQTKKERNAQLAEVEGVSDQFGAVRI